MKKLPKINEKLLKKFVYGEIEDSSIIEYIKYSLEVNSKIKDLFETIKDMKKADIEYPDEDIQISESAATMRFLNMIKSRTADVENNNDENNDNKPVIYTLLPKTEMGMAAGKENNYDTIIETFILLKEGNAEVADGKQKILGYIIKDVEDDSSCYKWSLKKIKISDDKFGYQIIIKSLNEIFEEAKYYIIKNGERVLTKIKGYDPKIIMDEFSSEIDFTKGITMYIEKIND